MVVNKNRFQGIRSRFVVLVPGVGGVEVECHSRWLQLFPVFGICKLVSRL